MLASLLVLFSPWSDCGGYHRRIYLHRQGCLIASLQTYVFVVGGSRERHGVWMAVREEVEGERLYELSAPRCSYALPFPPGPAKTMILRCSYPTSTRPRKKQAAPFKV